jgi:hypothetical protein
MREVISLNGKTWFHPVSQPSRCSSFVYVSWLVLSLFYGLLILLSAVGQAGCQIANSCWEVGSRSGGRSHGIQLIRLSCVALLPRTRHPGKAQLFGVVAKYGWKYIGTSLTFGPSPTDISLKSGRLKLMITASAPSSQRPVSP